MNVKIKYYLFIFISLFFISCDFDEIESFEMPAWNWPLSFPLLDESYSFAEMGVALGPDSIYYNAAGDSAVNNNIFFDEIDSTLFIEFSANLLGDDGTKVGVDEEFSNYFSISAPSFDSEALGSISTPPFPIPSISVIDSFPVPLSLFLIQSSDQDLITLISLCNFFPTTLVGSEGFNLETTSSMEILPLDDFVYVDPSSQDTTIKFTSVDKVTFDDGNVSVEITNNYPFSVDLVEIIFSSNDEQLFLNNSNENTFEFNNIMPGEVIEKIFIIDSNNTIDFGDSLDIQSVFFVDNLIGTGGENPYEPGLCRYSNDGWYLCPEPAQQGTCIDEYGNLYDDFCFDDVQVDDGLLCVFEDKIFDIQINFNIENAKSITGKLEIEPIVQQIAIPMQETAGIQIVGGHLEPGIIENKNSLNLDIENKMFSQIDFSMVFSNFYSADSIILGIDTVITVGDPLNHQLKFNDYYLGHSSEPGQPIDTIIVTTSLQIDDSQNVEFLLDGGYELKINDISFSDIQLEYVTAAAQDLSFETPSINIDNIPSGFEGFEFSDLSLEFDVFNQIGIPVNLQLELIGNKLETGESVSILIDPELSYNIVDADSNVFLDGNASLQDSAWTKIILDKNGQTTYRYVLNENKTDYELLQLDIPNFENPKIEAKDVTILDVMTIAPDELLVSGGARIEGQGVLAPETYVWGGFTMVAPLSFIFSKDIQFIPAEPTILSAMDESTRNKIDSSLVVAKLSLDITNSIPIAGNIGLLISDYNSDLCLVEDSETCLENYFPVYFDSFVTNVLSAQEGEVGDDYKEIFDNDLLFLEQDLGVSEVYVEKDNEETLYINFLDSELNTIFFIGRIFNLDIEAPYEIDSQTGFSVDPSKYIDEIELDTTRIDWITSETDLFMMPMITFDNTTDFYCEDGSECDEDGCDSGDECIREPRTFQTTNSMDINSFITFTLNTGALFERQLIYKEKNSNNEFKNN